jgi:hypothetical protein
MEFYSARLLFIVLVDDGRPRKTNLYDESVVVFRARDLKEAQRKALKIGRDRETEGENLNGEKVRWAFVEIINLDWVGKKIDGKEVASYLHKRRSKKPVAFRRKFEPEGSEPSGSF